MGRTGHHRRGTIFLEGCPGITSFILRYLSTYYVPVLRQGPFCPISALAPSLESLLLGLRVVFKASLSCRQPGQGSARQPPSAPPRPAGSPGTSAHEMLERPLHRSPPRFNACHKTRCLGSHPPEIPGLFLALAVEPCFQIK